MDCDSFLRNPSIDPYTKSPLSKEQLIEFRKACGFNKEIDKEEALTYTSNIFNDHKINVNTSTIQPVKSLDNIKWWMYSQKKYIDNLNNSDLTIIQFYETVNVYEWNSILRGITDPCKNKEKTPTDYINEFLWFYELITKSPKTPHMYLFRGENSDNLDTYNIPYSKDGNIQKEGFISMSLSILQAYNFAYYKFIDGVPKLIEGNINKVIYMVEIPAGTPALFLGAKNFPILDDRIEVVLPPCIWRYTGNKQFNIENKIINVKTAKLEVISPLNKTIKNFNSPTQDTIIYEFIERLLKNENKGYTWVIEGSYGFNILLYNRYKVQNLKTVPRVYITAYYSNKLKISTSYKIYEDISEEIQKLYGLSEDRIFALVNAEQNETHSYLIRYSICPNRKNDVIHLRYLKKDFDKGLIDNELYKKIGLPIKTKEGYMKEINDILEEPLKDHNSDFMNKPKEELLKMYNLLKSLP